MTAPASPFGLLAADGRAASTERGTGGQRRPPGEAGAFADIISKLAAPSQGRGDIPAGAAGEPGGAPAARASSEASPTVADPAGAGRRAAATDAPPSPTATALPHARRPATDLFPAVAAAPARDVSAHDETSDRPGAPRRPGTTEPLAVALAASAGRAEGEHPETVLRRREASGVPVEGTPPAASGGFGWPVPTTGAAEPDTAGSAGGREDRPASGADRQAADLGLTDVRGHEFGLPDHGGPALPADGAAFGPSDGTAPTAPALTAAASRTTAATAGSAAAPDAGRPAPTDPGAPMPATAADPEAPAAAPDRAVERVTATVRDMRTHFAPIAPRRAALPKDPAPASGPDAGPAADPVSPASATAAKPVLPTVPTTAAVPAAAAAATAVSATTAAAQPSAPAALAGDGTATGNAIGAGAPDADGAARRDRPMPVEADRAAPAARRDERPAPALGDATEPVRARDPAAATGAERRLSSSAGATPAVETAPSATGNGFPATLHALAKDIGEAARAAAGGAGTGQTAGPAGLAAAATGGPALRRDVEIDLSSSELGVVKVRMRLTGSSLEVRVRTEDAATLALLADRRGELERAISETGVEARIIDVTRTSATAGSAPGPGPQPPAGNDGREASGQGFGHGADAGRGDERHPTEDQAGPHHAPQQHTTHGTTDDEDHPARTGPRAGALFV